jgi:hypothetical protein
MTDESITVDELVHLPAGYSYVERGDYRLNREHPPFSKLWAALPLLFTKVAWPDAEPAWRKAEQSEFGFRFFYQSGNNPDRILAWARRFMLFWPCLLLVTIHAVARDLYGPRAGLLALLLATLCPTILAHGHLATTDVVLATLFLLTLAAFQRLSTAPDLLGSLFAGILLGALLSTKFVAVVLLPGLALAALVGWARRRLGATQPLPAAGRSTLATLLSSVPIVLLAALSVIWAMYGFRSDVSRSDHPPIEVPQGSGSWLGTLLGQPLLRSLFPQGFIDGLLFQMGHSREGHAAYAFGRYSQDGWWWYFPVAFLVKTPLPSLILMGWGLVRAIGELLRGSGKGDLFLIPCLTFWGFALAGSIDIGIRLILPVYPILFIFAGAVPTPEAGARWIRRIPEALLALSAAGAILAFPYYLSYFNAPSRLFFNREEMLADSNLDWGQDLRRLKEYLDRNGIPSIKLAYFGSGSPRALGLRHEVLPASNFYSRFETEWPKTETLSPGDIVAISVMNRLGVLSSQDREFYRRTLGSLRPEATIGHSILLYRIPVPERSP